MFLVSQLCKRSPPLIFNPACNAPIGQLFLHLAIKRGIIYFFIQTKSYVPNHSLSVHYIHRLPFYLIVWIHTLLTVKRLVNERGSGLERSHYAKALTHRSLPRMDCILFTRKNHSKMLSSSSVSALNKDASKMLCNSSFFFFIQFVQCLCLLVVSLDLVICRLRTIRF